MPLTIIVLGDELGGERYLFPLRQALDEPQGVLRGDGRDDIVRWCTEKLGDDRELVNVYGAEYASASGRRT